MKILLGILIISFLGAQNVIRLEKATTKCVEEPCIKSNRFYRTKCSFIAAVKNMLYHSYFLAVFLLMEQMFTLIGEKHFKRAVATSYLVHIQKLAYYTVYKVSFERLHTQK